MKGPLKFLKHLKLHDITDEFTVGRYGSFNDGGYVCAKEIVQQSSNLYSFGIGDDVAFEFCLFSENRQMTAELYDPTIESLPADCGRAKFFKKSLAPNLTAGEVQNKSIVKIDVEGDEWDALDKTVDSVFERTAMLVIEFHFLTVPHTTGKSPYFTGVFDRFNEGINEQQFDLYARVLQRLNHHFYCFHLHPNNSIPQRDIGGIRFPQLLEASFINKRMLNAPPPRVGFDALPILGLDHPNKTDRADITLPPSGWVNINE